MKVLKLDYSTWRCGGDEDNQLGQGYTLLRNDKGYMCCLGQFAPQLNPKVSRDDIMGFSNPADVEVKIPALNKRVGGVSLDTNLSVKAMRINDDEETTPEEKITALRKLFKSKGYKIRVINKKKLS